MTTIFITGAGRGIGRALAETCLADGMTVLVGLRRPQDLPASLAGKVEAFALDVADPASVMSLGRRLAGRAIDVLVNNAGIIGPERQSTQDMDFDGFLHTLRVNTLGPLRVTQALLPCLRLSKDRPRILVVSSKMGSMAAATSDRIAYRASKAAVNKVFQGLATDLRPDGIAVATLHPGWVRTDMGGVGADIDTATSVRGIKSLIDRLSIETTGQFWNHDGSKLPF